MCIHRLIYSVSTWPVSSSKYFLSIHLAETMQRWMRRERRESSSEEIKTREQKGCKVHARRKCMICSNVDCCVWERQRERVRPIYESIREGGEQKTHCIHFIYTRTHAKTQLFCHHLPQLAHTVWHMPLCCFACEKCLHMTICLDTWSSGFHRSLLCQLRGRERSFYREKSCLYCMLNKNFSIDLTSDDCISCCVELK